jgi:hypothetical protein
VSRAASVPRFVEPASGKTRGVRVMFAAYLIVIAVGLSVYIAVGLLHR